MLDKIKRHLEFIISLVLLTGLAGAELIQHGSTKKLPEELLLWLALIFLANITRRLIYPGRQITGITNRLTHMHRDLRDIKSALAPDVWDKVGALSGLLDPNIEKVIGPNVQELLNRLRGIFHDNTFEISNLELFRSFYMRTLHSFTCSTFMATSIPRRDYFWGDPAIDQAILDFVKTGGSMQRIFFLNSAEELREEEPRRIMLRQKQLQVEVYTIVVSQVPDHLQQLFMVDSEARIAWEVIRGPSLTTSIKRVTLHWKDGSGDDRSAQRTHKSTQAFREMFGQLLALPGTQRFTGTDTIVDPQSNIYVDAVTQGQAPAAFDHEAFWEFEHDGWESSAAAYSQFFEPLTQQSIGPLLDATAVDRGMNVLDVATGPGYAAAAARRRGATAMGVDFSEKMIQRAREANPGIMFQAADAVNLPFDAESFDVVLINFGVLHFGEPAKAFAEAWRVLRKGGRLGFTVWAQPEKARGLQIIFHAIDMCGNTSITLPSGPPFFMFSDPATSEHALERAGFVDVNTLELSLLWKLESSDQFFKAFYDATARTRGRLRVQSADALAKIKDSVRGQCREYEKDGKLRIPMTAVMVTARKPK